MSRCPVRRINVGLTQLKLQHFHWSMGGGQCEVGSGRWEVGMSNQLIMFLDESNDTFAFTCGFACAPRGLTCYRAEWSSTLSSLQMLQFAYYFSDMNSFFSLSLG